MKFIADLHLHSRYSMATSKFASPEGYYQWGKIKGINVIGTGDFTHPAYYAQLKETLVQDESGFYVLKDPPGITPSLMPVEGVRCEDIPVKFCLSTEISSIYKKKGKTRKVHSLIFAPHLEAAGKIRTRLGAMGNINADGRPILGVDPKDLLEIILEASEECYLIPAHVWTPWFSLFGSKSGFDHIEECFEELTSYIFALETGLSSDPEMNWRWSALDRFTLVSNSDAHSPQKLGREANLFDTSMTYQGMFQALKTGKGFLGTVEFYPEEGKYHMDGHRKCGVCLEPGESRQLDGLCPVCGKPMTLGVTHRVMDLADRDKGEKPPGGRDYHYIVPLPEIVAEIMGKGPASKGVVEHYGKVVSRFGNEFNLLLNVPEDIIRKEAGPVYAEAIGRMRSGRIDPSPGFDGEFGVIKIFQEGEVEQFLGQDSLFALNFGEIRRKTPGGKSSIGLKKKEESPAVSSPGGLNPEQSRVLEHREGALLITAGPGTGKTRTLTAWINALIREEGVPGENILAITFTNKAARQMEERLKRQNSHLPHVRTFHAFCFELIKEKYPFIHNIIDSSRRRGLIKLLTPGMGDKSRKSLVRKLEQSLEDPLLELTPGEQEWRKIYLGACKKMGSIDLVYLVSGVNMLFSIDPGFREKIKLRFPYVAVDELQDINPGQYELLMNLQNKAFLGIGDPDQAIYGFRGADLKLFFQFREKAREIFLVENWRSSGTIVKAAEAVVLHNSGTSGLSLHANRDKGQSLTFFKARSLDEEGIFIVKTIESLVGGFSMNSSGQGDLGFGDIGVLFRTRKVGEALLPYFRRDGIPVGFREAEPLLGREPYVIISHAMALLLNPGDSVAAFEILCFRFPSLISEWELVIKAGMEKTDGVISFLRSLQLSTSVTEAIDSFEKDMESFRFLWKSEGVEALIREVCTRWLPETDEAREAELELLFLQARDQGTDLETFYSQCLLAPNEGAVPFPADRVHLLTFHAAKGLEFPVVFLAGVEEGIVPLPRGDREEERRLFYVALTRAKERVFVTAAGKRNFFGTLRDQVPSSFINEIPEKCLEIKERERKAPDPYDQGSLF